MSRTIRNERDPDSTRKGRNPHARRAIVHAAAALIVITMAAGARAEQPVSAGCVNVNSASPEQLAYLPGVGPKLAELIVAGRPYASAAELDNVKGVGPAKLKAMTPYVVIVGETTATAKIKAAVTK